ncbi:hypothetical protein K2V69_13430 [Staphylococcus gallinarum]|uniref:hypothetical protein n=1 Tax=Staphylococcus gallinarum TaxID=1293 RepID=UPI001E5980D9|nr:hypothetical protein [Staphylococcus gallinarum]MCD8921675.1 hypothetical protein [Staphylococcus gallinarum]
MENKNVRELDEMTYAEIFERYSDGLERINNQFTNEFIKISRRFVYKMSLAGLLVGICIGIVVGIFI